MDFNHDHIQHSFPLPRSWSSAFVLLAITFTYMSHLTHDDVNKWLATFAALCALTSYGYKFICYMKHRKPTKK